MNGLASGVGFARLVDGCMRETSERVVLLPRGRFRRPLRMRLRFTPWWPGPGPRTLVELLPEEHVAPTARYYEAGHRLLDEVVCAAGATSPVATTARRARLSPSGT